MNESLEISCDCEHHVLPHERVVHHEEQNVPLVQPLLNGFQVASIYGFNPNPPLIVALIDKHDIECLDAHHDAFEAGYINLRSCNDEEGTLHHIHYTILGRLKEQPSSIPVAFEGYVSYRSLKFYSVLLCEVLHLPDELLHLLQHIFTLLPHILLKL